LLPEESALHYTRALVLDQLQRLDEAQAAYDHALLLGDPPERVHFAQAGTCLMQGDFNRGWTLYEDRPTLGATLAPWLALGLERLPAGASADGRGVLLIAEQGYGDILQFARFAADLAARCGAPVWLVGPPVLRGLLGRLAAQARLAGVLEVLHTHRTELPEGLGWVLPLGSLPLHLGWVSAQDSSPGPTTPWPHAQAYLTPDPARVAHWQPRLGPQTRPRVAIAWSGAPGRKADWGRSLALAQLLPWLPEGIDYLHLQPDLRETDREALAAAPQVQHFGAEIRDFDDSAALCMLADHVVSVCTSAAHLAGALGRPTTVLLRHTPCWRWGRQGEACAAYASARLVHIDDLSACLAGATRIKTKTNSKRVVKWLILHLHFLMEHLTSIKMRLTIYVQKM
jgi:hypothetical protein